MTSGETAQGLFPVETISTMTKINQAAELTFNYDRSIKNFNKSLFKGESSTIALAIAKKTAPTNQKTVKAVFPYELVVLFNDNDQVIKAVSNIRPGAHVIVVTDQKDQYTKYGTYYGVTTYLVGSLSAVSKDQKELKTTFNKIVKQYAVGSKKAIAYVNKKFVTFTK
jgi:pyruvate kinase